MMGAYDSQTVRLKPALSIGTGKGGVKAGKEGTGTPMTFRC